MTTPIDPTASGLARHEEAEGTAAHEQAALLGSRASSEDNSPVLDKAPWGHETLAKDDFERGLVSALDNPTQSAQAQMPDVVDQVALAKLYGEPLFALPQDLYIPPDALEVFLEAFEGPLDLLLYLIRKQNFNILDIPMAALKASWPRPRKTPPWILPMR